MANSSSFVNFLNSQGPSEPFDCDSSEPQCFTSPCSDESTVKERRKWSPNEDIILIGAWLNTSKDPITNNEQKIQAFWKRIVEYYNSSPLLIGTVPRELGQLKQRWARINDLVGKFAGCYDTALRMQKSGFSENDAMRDALDLFHSDHNVKFNLAHAWRELRHDAKWCSTYVDSGKDKRKQADVSAGGSVAEQVERPIGIKAAKAAKRLKKSVKQEEYTQLEGLLETKKQIYKHSLLESLISKTEPLSEMELSVKMKLLAEMM